MSNLIEQIRRAQVRAAEDAVIASIPKSIKDVMDQAQRDHEAKGGCPGCGSKVFAVHTLPCSVLDNEPDFY